MPTSSPSDPQSPPPRPFAGDVVTFGGRLSLLSRHEAEALVVRLGGTVAGDVTDRTTVLVLGLERSAARTDPAGAPEAGGTSKLRRAKRMNARSPGRIRILSESEFCRLAGLQEPGSVRQQFYSLRELRGRYPALREDHLRYLEKWRLVQPAWRTRTDRYYAFADLRLIREVANELARGVSFRAVLRSLTAAREGQLVLDFRSSGGGAQPARVIALAPRERPPAPVSHQLDLDEVRRTDAARHFLQASHLDDGDETQQTRAAQAYRRALVADPDLVPALVNLANIHYAWDQLVEAQALYERAIGLEPGCFEARFNLGNVHHDLARYAEAERAYRQALALNPTYPDAHFYLAVTLEKLGRSAEARPHWREYQRLAPQGEWVELAREFSDEGP